MQQKGVKARLVYKTDSISGIKDSEEAAGGFDVLLEFSVAKTRAGKRPERKFAATPRVNVRRGSFKDLYRASGTPAPPSPSEADEVAWHISSVIYVGCGAAMTQAGQHGRRRNSWDAGDIRPRLTRPAVQCRPRKYQTFNKLQRYAAGIAVLQLAASLPQHWLMPFWHRVKSFGLWVKQAILIIEQTAGLGDHLTQGVVNLATTNCNARLSKASKGKSASTWNLKGLNQQVLFLPYNGRPLWFQRFN